MRDDDYKTYWPQKYFINNEKYQATTQGNKPVKIEESGSYDIIENVIKFSTAMESVSISIFTLTHKNHMKRHLNTNKCLLTWYCHYKIEPKQMENK